jgi:hypothetical protein
MDCEDECRAAKEFMKGMDDTGVQWVRHKKRWTTVSGSLVVDMTQQV